MMPVALGTVRDIPVRALKLCGLTWTGQFLWFSEAVQNQLIAVDPFSGSVQHRLPCDGVRTDLTSVGGNLVQIAGDRRALLVIDPVSGELRTELPNPRPGNVLCGLEAGSQGLWFGYADLQVVDLRRADDLELIESLPVISPVAGLTVSDAYLIYADHREATINLVDIERRREVAAYSVHGNPTGITWDGARIWYCDYTTLQLRAIEVPGMVKA